MTLSGVFAGLATGPVYYSADGASWATAGDLGKQVFALAFFGDNVYAVCKNDDNVYASDGGGTWSSVYQFWGGGGNGYTLQNGSLIMWRGCLYASYGYYDNDGAYFEIARSADGSAWSTVFSISNPGWTTDENWWQSAFSPGNNILYCAVADTIKYATVAWNVRCIYSTANGTDWTHQGHVAEDGPFGGRPLHPFAWANGSFYHARSDGSIYYGTQAQFETSSGSPTLAAKGYLSTSDLTPEAWDWSYTDSGLAGYGGMTLISTYLYNHGSLYVAPFSAIIKRSPVAAISWSTVYTGAAGQVYQMAGCDNKVFAASTSGVVASTDGGATWSVVQAGDFRAIAAQTAIHRRRWMLTTPH